MYAFEGLPTVSKRVVSGAILGDRKLVSGRGSVVFWAGGDGTIRSGIVQGKSRTYLNFACTWAAVMAEAGLLFSLP